MRPETDSPSGRSSAGSETDGDGDCSPIEPTRSGLDHLAELKQRVIDSVVVQDPDPRYSVLDQLDGLTGARPDHVVQPGGGPE